MTKTALDQLSYSVPQFAAAVGLSESAISKEIRENRIAAVWYGTKRLITREEGQRWLATLPADDPRSA